MKEFSGGGIKNFEEHDAHNGEINPFNYISTKTYRRLKFSMGLKKI